MDFGKALEALKAGKKVARQGWNGKGMFLYLTSGSEVERDKLKAETRNVLEPYMNAHGCDSVEICPHIDMKAADGTIVIGWLASQTDMLAEDWEIVWDNPA